MVYVAFQYCKIAVKYFDYTLSMFEAISLDQIPKSELLGQMQLNFYLTSLI